MLSGGMEEKTGLEGSRKRAASSSELLPGDAKKFRVEV